MWMAPSSIVAEVVGWIECNRTHLSDHDRRTLMGNMLRALSSMSKVDRARIIRHENWSILASIVEPED